MAESGAKPGSDAEVEGLSSSSETSEDECIKRNLSSKPTLRELHQLPVTKWYNLGLQLEVNQGELEKIQSKHPQNDRTCQTKMFGVWLREVENPNYEKLLKALAAIGRRDIAESVCEKEGFTLDGITRASSITNNLSQQTSGFPAQLMNRPITKDVERQPVDISQKQIVPPERQTTLLSEPQLVGIIRLGERDVPKLMTILSKYAYKWEDIGIALGFTVPELRGISSRQALILNSPNSFLLEMLNGWVNWPNEAHSSLATVEALETALQSQLVGLGVVSEQLRNELQQITTADNQPSQIKAPPCSSQPPKIPQCIERYARYLKSRYRKMPLLPQSEWPPTLGSQYSEITMVERDRSLPNKESVKESLEVSLRGKVDELAKNEKVIKSLDEIFTSHAGDTDSSSLKVLVEGVPGAGKTTLVQKTCKDWADGTSLQQFNLVVLVALRKKVIERAESLEELLPADDPDLKEEVIRDIKESSGEHVLFIFDGFDELIVSLRSSSPIFLEIIQGELFHNCAAILTSRPYASDALKTDAGIHRHVDILGFTEKQIESYVMHNISNTSKARSLVKSLTEQIAITSFSYTPLSCSILVYIFKQKKFKLPNTLTELFDAFISSIVKRHAKKQKLNLLEPLKDQFNALCKLAYDSLVEGKFSFSPQDIENMYPGGDVLSLMTSATSFSIHGEETHYQFLHMTIQEFLAARWIATQSVYEQKKFLLENLINLKMKPVLVFFAGITQLKGVLDNLFKHINRSGLLHSVLVVGSLRQQESLGHSLPQHERETTDATQVFLCLASMIDETKDPSLVKRFFQVSSIEGFHLDFCRLTPMDCTAVANFLSNCPYHLPTVHFNFCNLTSVSLEIFHRISTTTPNCWNQCTKVQVNYNPPSFSTSLSLLPQIKWFQHTTMLCLRGLQYPKGLPPEEFQLHTLLTFKALSDLTITVERIPSDHLKDHEAVLKKFFEALTNNNTLSSLTYDQTPPATNCELFVQLTSALLQNKLSLTLGHVQVFTKNAVILPSKACFKIRSNGLVSAMKLADTRDIAVLEAHSQDLFLDSCTCRGSNDSKVESRLVTPCSNQCDTPAEIYCSNCSANLCESCSKTIHQNIFKNHKLISIESTSPDVSALAASLKSTSLAVLDISECTLTNEVAQHIGAGLAENKSLIQLNIKALAGAEAVHIFRALEHNSSVQKLKVSLAEGIGSSETVVTALSQMLKINKSLSVLDLSGCSITDAVAQHIASGLAENKTLQALNINSDQLKSEGAGYILQSLQHNETLNTLRVFNLHVQITSAPLTLSVTAGTSNKRSLTLLVSSLLHTSIEKLQMFTGIGVLDLSRCSITDAMAEKIVAGLTENGSLKCLDLSGNEITDAMVEKIAAGLTENSSLKQLDLSSNEITSVGTAHLFRSLQHNTSLDKLLLSCNPQLVMVDSELFGCRLQQMLSKNKSLTMLDLSECGVTDVVAQHIASGLTKNKTLQALNINSDQLKTDGAGYILQSLQQNETLCTLRMFDLDMQITHAPLTLRITAGASNKQSLSLLVSSLVHTSIDKFQMFTGTEVLDLSQCGVTDAMAEKIAAGLTGNSSLKQLDLSGNEITSVGAAHIFRSLEHNTSLDKLLLSCNPQLAMGDSEMFGSGLQEMLSKNKSLTMLDLSGCGLTDAVAQYIARGLTENKTLKALSIDSVHLTHEGVKYIYQSVKENLTIKILKQFGINLEILYNPFHLVISIEEDTHAALNIFKSLEQNTTVEGLVISKLPTSNRTNDEADEALGCAVEGMLTVNQTLRILNLQLCYLNEVITGHIANGLAKNSSVKQLNLKSNGMLSWTGTSTARIFKSLKHNTSLEELDLSIERFSRYQSGDSEALGCAVEEILTVNQTLRILNLQRCDVNDEIAGHIATGLTKNSSVKQLNLSCIITSVGAVHIFKCLEQNVSLEELDLSSNEFFSHNLSATNDDSEALGCAVERMLTVNQTLRILNLKCCRLNDEIAGHIATGLTKNSSVKQLNLKLNRITSVGAVNIFKSLEHSTSLEELDLSSNRFTSFYRSDDSEALGCAVERMLRVNQTLRELNLQDCGLNDTIMHHIATGLKYNTSCRCNTQPKHIPPSSTAKLRCCYCM